MADMKTGTAKSMHGLFVHMQLSKWTALLDSSA